MNFFDTPLPSGLDPLLTRRDTLQMLNDAVLLRHHPGPTIPNVALLGIKREILDRIL